MERTTFTVLAFAAFAAMAFFLLRKAEAGYQGIADFQGRSAFSTGSFFNPALEPRAAVDGNPATVWAEAPPVKALCVAGVPETRDPVEMPPCLFLQVDLGFTHAPANPPVKRPPIQMKIQNGPAAYARPRTVHLVFFSQEIIDMDREFRLPPLPKFLAEKTLVLADASTAAIDLGFLPPPAESPRYPAGVQRLQVRIEIRDVYPGTTHANTVAISEVTYSHRAE